MFGIHLHRHKNDEQQHENAEPASSSEPATEHASSGPIPSVSPHADAQIAAQQPSASEQAYDAGAPKNYKDKSWANRGFEALDDEQRALLEGLKPGEGEHVWGELDQKRHAGFLNITAVIRANGFSLSGLHLQPVTKDDTSGIQQDRLLFTPATGHLLKAPLEAAIREKESRGDRGFIEDKPDGHHKGMQEWGGRQWCTRFSMQVGGGSAGAFVDIDEFGPKVDVVGTVGHIGEVIRNHFGHSKTDPFTIAKGLHGRGDDP